MNLKETLSKQPEPHGRGPYRYIPTSFDPDDPKLEAYARNLSWRWSALERFFDEVKPTAVVLRLPGFWQANFAVFDACHDRGVPLFVNEPENTPLGAASLKHAGIDTVITTRADAESFIAYVLDKQGLLPRCMYVVSPASGSERGYRPIGQMRVRHEVHAAPGIPILEQCAHLESAGTDHFHVADDVTLRQLQPFVCEVDKIGPRPLPDVRIAFDLKETTRCACGKSILERV